MSASNSEEIYYASQYSPERLEWKKSSKWTQEHRSSYICSDPERFVDLAGYEIPPEGWYQHEFIYPWPDYWDSFIDEVQKEPKFHGIKVKPVMGYIRKGTNLVVVFWGESEVERGMTEDSCDEPLNTPKHTLALMVQERKDSKTCITTWSPISLGAVLKGMYLHQSRYEMSPDFLRPPSYVQVWTGTKFSWVRPVIDYLGRITYTALYKAIEVGAVDHSRKWSALERLLYPKLNQRVDVQDYDLSNLYWSISPETILPGQWDSFEQDIKQHESFRGVDVKPVAGFESYGDERTVIFWGQTTKPSDDGSSYTVALKLVQGQSVTSYTPMPLADLIKAISFVDEKERKNAQDGYWDRDHDKFYTKLFKAPSHVNVSRGNGAVPVLEPVKVTKHKVVKCPIVFGEDIHIHQRPTDPNCISCVPNNHGLYPLRRSKMFTPQNPMHALYNPDSHISKAKTDVDPRNVDIRPCRTPKGWWRYEGCTSESEEENYKIQVHRALGIDVKVVASCSLDSNGGRATIYWGEKHRENQAPYTVALEHKSGYKYGETKLHTPMPLKTLLESMDQAKTGRKDFNDFYRYRFSLPDWVRTQTQVEGEADNFERVITKTYDREQEDCEESSDLRRYFERVYSDSEGNGDEYVDTSSESGIDDGSSTSSGSISSVPDSDVDIEELRLNGEVFEFEH